MTSPGELAALANGDPPGLEGFRGHEGTTGRGGALAIVRPTRPVEITLRVEGPGLESAMTSLTAR